MLIIKLYLLSLNSLLLGGFRGENNVDRHAIYLSTLEVSTSGLTVKVFQDDLQDAVRNHCEMSETKCELNESFSNINTHKAAILSYFKRTLSLEINAEKKELSLIKILEQGDSYWIYFSFSEQAEPWKYVTVSAGYFMELFPKQVNVVKVSHQGASTFCKQTLSDTSCTLQF